MIKLGEIMIEIESKVRVMTLTTYIVFIQIFSYNLLENENFVIGSIITKGWLKNKYTFQKSNCSLKVKQTLSKEQKTTIDPFEHILIFVIDRSRTK